MRGIQRYRANRVESAPPIQIVVMLYQEAVHRLTRALQLLEDGDATSQLVADLHHVREIYTELRFALDHDASPELCDELTRIYGWTIEQLIVAGRERAKQPIEDVLKVTMTLLEGWQAVANGQAAQPAPVGV